MAYDNGSGYENEDAYLDSYWEDRTDVGYEDAPDWFWGPEASADEDEDEEFDCEEISYEERHACDLYNERYSYPYRD
jgi:hypothetical protein